MKESAASFGLLQSDRVFIKLSQRLYLAADTFNEGAATIANSPYLLINII